MTEAAADTAAPDPLAWPAGSRGRLAAEVREAREPLSGCRFDNELLRLFAKRFKSAVPSLAALALLVGVVAATWASWPAVLVWLILNLAGLGLACCLVRVYLARAEALPNVRRCIFVSAEVLQGTVWAAAAWLVGGSGDSAAQSFVLVLFSLTSAMTATALASLPAAVTGAVAPMALASLAFVHPAVPSSGASPVMLLALGTQLCFMLLAYKLHKPPLRRFPFKPRKTSSLPSSNKPRRKAMMPGARRRRPTARSPASLPL
jgi:hypothetical protein